jgi:hypothetical protein
MLAEKLFLQMSILFLALQWICSGMALREGREEEGKRNERRGEKA